MSFKKPDTYRDVKGAFFTIGLFYELASTDACTPLFTLSDFDREVDGKTYLSFKRLYLEMEDITEYEFANTYLESWNHFLRLQSNRILRDLIEECRSELALKLRARGVKAMVNVASNPDAKEAVQAAKWLATKGWESASAKRGRPSKAERERALEEETRLSKEVSDDASRIQLIVNNGKK